MGDAYEAIEMTGGLPGSSEWQARVAAERSRQSQQILDRLIGSVARTERERAEAIAGVLEVLAEWSLCPFPSMTCREADRLFLFARTFGNLELANRVLYAHAADDEPGDEHHGMTEPGHG